MIISSSDISLILSQSYFFTIFVFRSSGTDNSLYKFFIYTFGSTADNFCSKHQYGKLAKNSIELVNVAKREGEKLILRVAEELSIHFKSIFSVKLTESVFHVVATFSIVDVSLIGNIFSTSSISSDSSEVALILIFAKSWEFGSVFFAIHSNATFFCSQLFIFILISLFLKSTHSQLIVTLMLAFLPVLLNIDGENTILSSDHMNLGVFSLIISFLFVTTVVSHTQIIFHSVVDITLSSTHVVRLSGSFDVVIYAIQSLSVVKSACQNAVSLNTHRFFFEFHHFCHSHAHHFSQSDVSLISSFSTRLYSDKKVSTQRYLFIS